MRSFDEVNTAQNTCISYYEAEFENIANSMKNGETRTVNERNLYNKSRQVKWRIYGTCLQELYEGFKRAGM